MRRTSQRAGVDIVLDSFGTVEGLSAALPEAQAGGLIVCVGQLPDHGVTVPFHLAATREIIVTGSSRFLQGIAGSS